MDSKGIVLSFLSPRFGNRGAKVIICIVLMVFGFKNSEIKKPFGISYDALRKYRTALMSGDIEPLFGNGGARVKSELDAHSELILSYFNVRTPKTPREALERIYSLTGIRRSINRIRVFLKKRAFGIGQ